MVHRTTCICKRCHKLFEGWTSNLGETLYCKDCRSFAEEEDYIKWKMNFFDDNYNLDIDKLLRYLYEKRNNE